MDTPRFTVGKKVADPLVHDWVVFDQKLQRNMFSDLRNDEAVALAIKLNDEEKEKLMKESRVTVTCTIQDTPTECGDLFMHKQSTDVYLITRDQNLDEARYTLHNLKDGHRWTSPSRDIEGVFGTCKDAFTKVYGVTIERPLS